MLSTVLRVVSLASIVVLAVYCLVNDGTDQACFDLHSKPWKEGERIVSQNGVQLVWFAGVMVL